MKKLFLFLLLTLSACTLPVIADSTPTPAMPPTPAVSVATIQVQSTAEAGSAANPLILALAPSPHPSAEVLNAANALAKRLEELTRTHIILVAPAYEADLVSAFQVGNAQLGLLSPYGYVQAYETGSVNALLASLHNGLALYGAQFLARKDAGFTSYFDPARGENTAEAAEALSQFKDKKPCWSNAASPSGYVIPLGLLKQAQVQTGTAAFVEGQDTVVRAIYGKGICDFGATYIDARTLPTLEADYPDVLEKVVVIWRSPLIIPYEQIVMASSLNPELKSSFLRAFIDIMNTPEGKTLIQTVYGMDAFQPADDGQYQQFGIYLKASGLDVNGLLK